MDPEFARSPTGKLVETVEGQLAFVPNPLPPAIDYTPHLNLLSEAASALGELNGASRRLANPNILLAPLRRQEALSSSAIEGTYSTATDLALLEADETAKASEDTREVRNYALALDFAISHLDNAPVSQWLLRSIHRQLLSGLSRIETTDSPGEYKTVQNFIGQRRQKIRDARFVPPPPLETRACMDSLEEYLRSDDASAIPPLIDAALAHYQFETIHPFGDGNGRVGRILIPIRLIQRKVAGGRLLYPSPYLADHKDEYIDALYEVSRSGAWSNWINFFLTAVRETASSAIHTIDRLIELQNRYQSEARRISRSANLGALVDYLFERPVVTIPRVCDMLSITYRSASQLVDHLVDEKILVEAPNIYPKTFVAMEIILVGRGDENKR